MAFRRFAEVIGGCETAGHHNEDDFLESRVKSMLAIDLNADLGEGCPWDEVLLDVVSTASVSCGAHAGDDDAIRNTLRMAKRRGVVVGAHPGYPDREGFGRRERTMTGSEVTALVVEQVKHLNLLADDAGVTVRFVKPHGALYNQSQVDSEMARGLVAAACSLGLGLFGLPDSEVAKAATDAGVPFVAEGFADRGYREDGRLIPRSEPGAMLDDPVAIAEQVVRLVNSRRIRTLCLHGDSPGAVRLAKIVRDAFESHGVMIRSFVT